MTGPVLPSKLLFDPDKKTQHTYVPAASTDIRVRFAEVIARQRPANTKNVSTLKRKTP